MPNAFDELGGFAELHRELQRSAESLGKLRGPLTDGVAELARASKTYASLRDSTLSDRVAELARALEGDASTRGSVLADGVAELVRASDRYASVNRETERALALQSERLLTVAGDIVSAMRVAERWSSELAEQLTTATGRTSRQLTLLQPSLAAFQMAARALPVERLPAFAAATAAPWMRPAVDELIDTVVPAHGRVEEAPVQLSAVNAAVIRFVLNILRLASDHGRAALGKADLLSIAVTILIAIGQYFDSQVAQSRLRQQVAEDLKDLKNEVKSTVDQGATELNQTLTAILAELQKQSRPQAQQDQFGLVLRNAPARARSAGGSKRVATLRAGQLVKIKQTSGAWLLVEFADEDGLQRTAWVFGPNLAR